MRRLLRVNWDNPITRGLVHLSPGGDETSWTRYDCATQRLGRRTTGSVVDVYPKTRRTRWGDMRFCYHNVSSTKHFDYTLRKGTTTGAYSAIVIASRPEWQANATNLFCLYGPSAWALINLGSIESAGVQVAQATTSIVGSITKTVTGSTATGPTSTSICQIGGRVRYGYGLELFLNGMPDGEPEEFTDELRDSANAWYTGQNTGYVGIAAGWIRALSNDEFAILNADPWQLFDNASERNYFWLPQIETEQSYSINVDVGTLTLTGQDITFSNEWLFDEALYPKAVQLTGLTGAYTDIDDNPSSPDGSWLLVA